MSDTDTFMENEISTDLDFEVSIDRELIAVVRVNRFLYDKTEKLYTNGNVKAEAWSQIGASLTYPLEGKFISIILKYCSGFAAICCYNVVDERGVTQQIIGGNIWQNASYIRLQLWSTKKRNCNT